MNHFKFGGLSEGLLWLSPTAESLPSEPLEHLLQNQQKP